MSEKLICHICGKEKKPYVVFLTDNVLSMIQHQHAREDGEICQRCDQYFAMTGEFKEATEKEFEIAKRSAWFSNMMLKWWEKDNAMITPDDDELYEMEDNRNKRDWEGTALISKWCREKLNSSTSANACNTNKEKKDDN